MEAPKIPVESLNAVIEYMKKEKEYLSQIDKPSLHKRVMDVLQPLGLNTTHYYLDNSLRGIYIEI